MNTYRDHIYMFILHTIVFDGIGMGLSGFILTVTYVNADHFSQAVFCFEGSNRKDPVSRGCSLSLQLTQRTP